MYASLSFMRRATLTLALLAGLLSAVGGPALAGSRSFATNDALLLSPPDPLRAQSPTDPAPFSHAPLFSALNFWRPAAPASPAQFDCGNVTEIPRTECEALVALYESTDGANWTDNTGWLTTNAPCIWYGVWCTGSNVTELYLHNNQLSGPIPPEIGNLTALTWLLLDGNQLSGPIPSQVGNLTALTWLDLSQNQLSGPIPSQIGNLTALEVLWLSNNQLSGPIPPQIGNLTALRSLWLEGNQLSGSIPSQIGDLTTLVFLHLGNNLLSGSIPAEIGNLTALAWLDLNNNQLSGPIPAQIGNLTALTELNLSGNPFNGEVPAALTPLTLEVFAFYDTEWCSPAEGAVFEWLRGIPSLYSTGLICGQGLGSLSGTVTLSDATPVAGEQVNLYRTVFVSSSTTPAWPFWLITTTHTVDDGTYQFTDLGQGLGIDYRVQFVDPTHQLAPQYYNGKPTIDAADAITITPGVPRTGIDAVLVESECISLTGVSIAGPLNVTSTLYIDMLYTFQAVITPTDASLPITYTWTPAPLIGQGTATAAYSWRDPGAYTVTLTAENCGGAVAATREFVVEYRELFTVYLPLVLRNH